MSDEDWSLAFLQGCRFWFPYVLVPMIGIIGIIGNLVTIIVLTRKRMKSSTNTYLTALATSDLLFLIFNMVLSLEHYKGMRHPENIIYWKIWRFAIWLADVTSGISIWLTVSFTLERYIAVCHPLKGKVMCTESRARKVICLIVLLVPLITITTPFEWVVELKVDEVKNTTQTIHYSDLGMNETYQKVFYTMSSILFMMVPFVILTVFNSLLINAVHQSQKHRNNLTEDCRGVSGSIRTSSARKISLVNNGGSSRGSKRVRSDRLKRDLRLSKALSEKHLVGAIPRRLQRERQENKITMALASVVCLFLVCQAPSAITLIVKLVYSPPQHSRGDNLLRGLGSVFNFLVLFNAACNFMLYCAMSDKYRQTLYMTFCPSKKFRHLRTNTFTSVASFRNSTIHNLNTELDSNAHIFPNTPEQKFQKHTFPIIEETQEL